jgi:hypothetical protein
MARGEPVFGRFEEVTTMVRTWAALGCLLAAAAVPGRAADAVLDQLYGEGVHAYFAGDYKAAHRQLDDSIRAGNRDPRCYFFRGLAAAKLGRAAEAEADFKSGARLESDNPDLMTTVSRSLQRVQGSTRTAIEGHRAAARVAAVRARRARDAARYGVERRRATEELEKRAAAPADEGAGLSPADDGEPAKPGDTPAEDVPAADAKPAEPAPTPEAADKPEAEAPDADPPKAEKPEADNPEADPSAKDQPDAEKDPAEKSPGASVGGKKPSVSLGALAGALARALGKAIAGSSAESPAAETAKAPKKETGDESADDAGPTDEAPKGPAPDDPAPHGASPDDVETPFQDDPAADADSAREKPAEK